MKVYGETEADRQRVLAYLVYEKPESNFDYIVGHERVYKGELSKKEIQLANDTMDQAMRLINFFCPREPDIFYI